jgi:hypothetical protein
MLEKGNGSPLNMPRIPSSERAQWATNSIGVLAVGEGDQSCLSDGVVFKAVDSLFCARRNSAIAEATDGSMVASMDEFYQHNLLSPMTLNVNLT